MYSSLSMSDWKRNYNCGMDIKVKRAEKGHFQTTVMACTSPTFYGWVFQWGGKIQITGPEAAVSEYKDMLESAQKAWLRDK